jgi:hypothetical protein
MDVFEAYEQEPENITKVIFTDVETRTVIVPSQSLSFFDKSKSKNLLI